MRREPTLADYGYPAEGIIDVDLGGGNGQEYPQEAFSPRTCGSCRKFNGGDWTCYKDGEDKDPDNDTCGDIDYQEEWLDNGYLRSPVRCEYSSDETYKQACEAIEAINRSIKDEYDRP